MSFLDELIDEDLSKKHVSQGSEAWEEIRVGRFTSSEFHNLMGHGWRQMTEAELAARPKKGVGSKTTRVPDFNQLSKEADTYIDEKCAEILTGRPKPESYAFPLVFGKEQEPHAVEYFQQRTGLECIETGFQTFTDHAGGSPDRLIGEDEGLEIKCPYTSAMQLRYMLLLHPQHLKDEFPEYYWQCVTLLLFTGRKRWHFCTYDDRFIKPEHKMTHLILEADKLQDEFERVTVILEKAIEVKLQRIQMYNHLTK